MSEFSDQYFRDLAPRERRYDLRVSDQLVFCVFPNGVKAWVYLYDADGHVRRRTIGLFPDMTYGDALRALDPNRRIAALEAAEQRRNAAAPQILQPVLPALQRIRDEVRARVTLRDVLAAGATAVVAFTLFVLIGGRGDPPPGAGATSADTARPAAARGTGFATEHESDAAPDEAAATALPATVAAETASESTPAPDDAAARAGVATASQPPAGDLPPDAGRSAADALPATPESDTTAAAALAAALDAERPEAGRVAADGAAPEPAAGGPSASAGSITLAADAGEAEAEAPSDGTETAEEAPATAALAETAEDPSAATASGHDGDAPLTPTAAAPATGPESADAAEAQTSTAAAAASEAAGETDQAPAAERAPLAAATSAEAVPPRDEPAPVSTAADYVARALLTANVVDGEPDGPLPVSVTIPADGDRLVYFFTEMNDSAPGTIVHRWLNEGTIAGEVPLETPAFPGGRLYSARRIGADQAGGWRVDALSPTGQLLASTSFTVVVDAGATTALVDESPAERE